MLEARIRESCKQKTSAKPRVEHCRVQTERNSDFDTRFVSAALVLGGIMTAAGYFLRPVDIGQIFTIENFREISNSMTIWIRSFQILVFGLFVRLAALAALSMLHTKSAQNAPVFAGTAICVSALLVTTLCEGYYMHMGAWGTGEIQNAGDAANNAFLSSIRPLSEWVICLARMGNMFFCFGFIILGFGFQITKIVGKWPGIAAMLIGAAGMMILMLLPNDAAAYLPISLAITLWFVALGATLTFGIHQTSQS